MYMRLLERFVDVKSFTFDEPTGSSKSELFWSGKLKKKKNETNIRKQTHPPYYQFVIQKEEKHKTI